MSDWSLEAHFSLVDHLLQRHPAAISRLEWREESHPDWKLRTFKLHFKKETQPVAQLKTSLTDEHAEEEAKPPPTPPKVTKNPAKREMSVDAAGSRAKKQKKEVKKVESDGDDEVLPDTPATQKPQKRAVVIPVKSAARTVKLGTPVDDDRSLTIGIDEFDWQSLIEPDTYGR